MAKSALLKSSIVKKYWMALTGLFLCLFLAGHLAGNLQLIFGTPLQFNEYALFMTSNPAVKILSYVTYLSILFHAIDGIALTFQNKAARPVGYAMQNASANSTWSSRNMALLGTVILVFIVTHMVNFWAVMHFDKSMPLYKTTIEVQPGMPQEFYVTTLGNYLPATEGSIKIVGNDFYDPNVNVKVAEGYKDLYKITVDFFKHPVYGLSATILYVLAMGALAFHLLHGFQSAFQSLGVTRFACTIKAFGKGYAIVVPLLFAIIPLYLHFIK